MNESNYNNTRYYIQIVAASYCEEDQLRWIGLVESKLRQLVMKLELIENINIGKSNLTRD